MDQAMKLTNPQIKIVNNVGQVRTRSFNPTNGMTTANTAYKEGAMAMADMFRDAIQSGNLKKVMDIAKATEQNSFYEY